MTRLKSREFGPGVHPFVKIIWTDLDFNRHNLSKVSRKSGVHEKTVREWRRATTSPNIRNLEAVLNALGYKLVAEKTNED